MSVTQQYCDKVLSGVTCADLQNSMLGRLIVLFRDLTIHADCIPESDRFLQQFEDTILQLTEKNGISCTVFSFIQEILLLPKKINTQNSLTLSLKTLDTLCCQVFRAETFEIFAKDSSSTIGIDLTTAAIYFLVKKLSDLATTTTDCSQLPENYLIYGFLSKIGEFFPALLDIQQEKKNNSSNKFETQQKQVSILSKGLFDCMNLIVKATKNSTFIQNQFFQLLNFELLIAISTILNYLSQKFDLKTIHFLTALLQRAGSILSFYLQNHLVAYPQTNGQVSLKETQFREKLQHLFNIFLRDMTAISKSSHLNCRQTELEENKNNSKLKQAKSELIESLLSLNALFIQKTIPNSTDPSSGDGSTARMPQKLSNEKEKDVLLMENLFQAILLYVSFHEDQLSQLAKEDEIKLIQSPGKLSLSTDSCSATNPVLEKYQKFIVYLVIMIFRCLQTNEPTKEKILEEFIVPLSCSNYILRNSLLFYLIQNRKSKYYSAMKENAADSMKNYFDLLKRLVFSNYSEELKTNLELTNFTEEIFKSENDLLLWNLNQYCLTRGHTTSSISSIIKTPESIMRTFDILKVKSKKTKEGAKNSIQQGLYSFFQVKLEISYFINKFQLFNNQMQDKNGEGENVEKNSEEPDLTETTKLSIQCFSDSDKLEIYRIFAAIQEFFNISFYQETAINSDEKQEQQLFLVEFLFLFFHSSEEFLSYFALIQLLGNHQLLYQIYSFFQDKKKDMLSRFSSNSLVYNAFGEFLSLLRVNLCIQCYWNYFPVANNPLHREKQLLKANSSQNLLELVQKEFSLSKSNSSISLLTCSSSSNNLLSSTTVLLKYSSQINIFLALEDFFHSCHQIILLSQPDSTQAGEEKEEITTEDGNTTTPSSETTEENDLFSKRLVLQRHLNYLVAKLSETSSCSSSSASFPFLKQKLDQIGILGWIYLFYARILFFQFGDIYETMVYCRLALSYCSHAKSTVSSGGNNNSIPIEWISPKFEVILLLAEVYEFMGKTQKTVDFLSESYALTMKFHYLESLYSLHSFRIFYRLQSSRIVDIVSPFLSSQTDTLVVTPEPSPKSSKKAKTSTPLAFVTSTSVTTTGDSVDSVNDEVIRDCILHLLNLFPEIVDYLVKKQAETTEEQRTKNNNGVAEEVGGEASKKIDFSVLLKTFNGKTTSASCLQYRFLFRYWGFTNNYHEEVLQLASPVHQSQNTGQKISDLYVTNHLQVLNIGSMNENSYLRRLFQGKLLLSSVSNEQSPTLSLESPQNFTELNHLIENFSSYHSYNKYNFAILKQLRKELCSYYHYHYQKEQKSGKSKIKMELNDDKEEDLPESTIFQSFLAGISSFHLSTEFSSMSLSTFSQNKSPEPLCTENSNSNSNTGNQTTANDILASSNSQDEKIFTTYGHIINQAMQYNDPYSKNLLSQKIKKLLSCKSIHSSKTESKLCFITMDHLHQQIIIGGVNHSESHKELSPASFQMKILPSSIYNHFMELIAKWNTLLKENDTSLTMFSFAPPEKLDSLTKEERNAWWKLREKINIEMKTVLKEINELFASVLQEMFSIQGNYNGFSLVSSSPTVPNMKTTKKQREKKDEDNNPPGKDERRVLFKDDMEDIVVIKDPEDTKENIALAANMEKALDELENEFDFKLTLDIPLSPPKPKSVSKMRCPATTSRTSLSPKSKPLSLNAFTPLKSTIKATTEPPTLTVDAIKLMKADQLRDECMIRELSAKGNKPDLVERLIHWLNKQQSIQPDRQQTPEQNHKSKAVATTTIKKTVRTSSSTATTSGLPVATSKSTTKKAKMSISSKSSSWCEESDQSSFSSAPLRMVETARTSATPFKSASEVITPYKGNNPFSTKKLSAPIHILSDNTEEDFGNGGENREPEELLFEDIHLYLMLDESLQNIPFESLDSLKTVSCSRLLSLSHLCSLVDSALPLLLSSEKDKKKTIRKTNNLKAGSEQDVAMQLDKKKCWYAIDVDNNLPSTKETLRSFLKKHESNNNCVHSWKGVVGTFPEKEFIR
jgi:hypothetical protein